MKLIKIFIQKQRIESEIPPEYRDGEIVHNNEEFYEELDIVLKERNRHKEEQERLLKIIHGNVDGRTSKRVVKVVKDLIKR